MLRRLIYTRRCGGVAFRVHIARFENMYLLEGYKYGYQNLTLPLKLIHLSSVKI